MIKKPAITVAIPTYNREEVLIGTICDVLAQDFHDLELIVIDQSKQHNDETLAALEAIQDPRFRYFKTTPPSVTAARNFALEQSQAPYIIFLDDDVRLDKGLVKAFIETFREKPDVSAIAGRVMQDGFEVLPKVLSFDEYGITHGGFTASKPAYTNAFPGGNCALKVHEALAIGGFDTRYRGNAFREENDLSMRMAKLGYKIYFQPKAELLHLAAPYGGNRVKTHIYDNFGFYKNELFFTIRIVERRFLLEALRRKYREYCHSVRHVPAYRRRVLFMIGLAAALWRIAFGKRLTARDAT